MCLERHLTINTRIQLVFIDIMEQCWLGPCSVRKRSQALEMEMPHGADVIPYSACQIAYFYVEQKCISERSKTLSCWRRPSCYSTCCKVKECTCLFFTVGWCNVPMCVTTFSRNQICRGIILWLIPWSSALWTLKRVQNTYLNLPLPFSWICYQVSRLLSPSTLILFYSVVAMAWHFPFAV